MSDLTFLDSLNEKQNQAALQVVQAAKTMGLDPRLALAIAYREGSLNLNTKNGSSGEIGMMQVLPTTAEMLGYKREDLQDPQKNIEIGLKYLKSGMDKFNDPVLAAAGYNAGMDKPYFNDPEKYKLPDRTKQYVKDIYGFGGFTTTPPVEGGAGEGAGNNAGAPKPSDKSVPASESDFRSTLAAGMGAALGGLGGAATNKLAEMSANRSVAAGTPVENWAKSMGYGNRGAQTYGQAHQFEQGTRKGASIRNPATGQTFKPEFNFQKPPIVQSTGQKVMETVGNTMNKAPRLSGALAGAGAGLNAQEAMARYNQGDYTGASIAGVGALGSLVSMIPTPFTRAGGTAVGMASPLALSVLDNLRKQPKTQQPPTQQELDTANKPYFGTARP